MHLMDSPLSDSLALKLCRRECVDIRCLRDTLKLHLRLHLSMHLSEIDSDTKITRLTTDLEKRDVVHREST